MNSRKKLFRENPSFPSLEPIFPIFQDKRWVLERWVDWKKPIFPIFPEPILPIFERWVADPRSIATSSSKACATDSKVISSWVGPMPPEVMTTSNLLEKSATCSAIKFLSSGRTAIWFNLTPFLKRVEARKAVFVSWTYPWMEHVSSLEILKNHLQNLISNDDTTDWQFTR